MKSTIFFSSRQKIDRNYLAIMDQEAKKLKELTDNGPTIIGDDKHLDITVSFEYSPTVKPKQNKEKT